MAAIRSTRNLALATLTIILAFGTSLTSYAQGSRPRQVSGNYSDRGATVPEDTIISMRLDRSLSSKTSRVGDRFTATVTTPVHIAGRVVIPAGSVVEGRVTEVTPAKRMSRSGTIAIDFDELVLPDGTRARLVGSLTSDDPETREQIDDESRVSGGRQDRKAVFVGGGGVVGAVLGGIAGGGKGAVLGGIIGAGAGVAGILLAKGEEAQVPSGTPFGIHLRQPLIFRDNAVAGSSPRRDTGRDREPVDSDDPDEDARSQPAPARTSRHDPREQSARTSRPDPRQQPPVEEPRSEPRSEPRDEPRSEPAEPEAAPLPLSSPEMVRRAQIALRDQGYYEGPVDGVMAARTAEALKSYQKENNLSETGDLDPETARRLGILGTRAAAERRNDRPASEPRNNRPATTGTAADRTPAGESVLANVLSASANRTPDGSINVVVTTQANSGGWRWFGEPFVNGDTLEVYARAVKPAGMATQVLTRGRIEVNVRDGVQYVRRVIVHGAGGDVNIPLGVRTNSSQGSGSGLGLQRQAEELLAEYQRSIGGRYPEPEIEVLFALDNFANATRLYSRLFGSLQDTQAQRAATLALAREARKCDAVMSTTSSQAAKSVQTKWDLIRQEVLRLMQTHNIGSAELDN
jgi:peptidoglycan hydrolase-like protein with peptidoglycan-binding domain